VSADRLIFPILLFGAFYVATLIVLFWLGFPFHQWNGLVSVTIATIAAVWFWENGEWPLGLFVPPRLALREGLLGAAWGIAIIGACALLVVLSTDVRHERGDGFPWMEVLIVFIPVPLHEELLFRGYPFQKLLQWNRWFAIVFMAVVFAGLHFNNSSVSALGLVNIFLGGILLGLAFVRYGRLWFPIGLHLAWNLMSGPILGHEVSGYENVTTVLTERGDGPLWLTGGEFGIEGSAIMTVLELVAIGWLAWQTEYHRPSGRSIPGTRSLQA
jgi:membrane protease YdiL (CAAX protease family)